MSRLLLVLTMLLPTLVRSRRLQAPALTPDSTCVDGDVGLSFDQSVVTQNNLGGVGPDSGEEAIVFSNVGTYQGDSINMKVLVKPGADYVVADNELDRNGMICYTARRSCEVGGDFGQVNLKSNEETTLLFQFQSDSTGEPVELPGFLFSGLDVDGEVEEETYVIQGWDTAFYDRDNTETYFSEDEEDFCDSDKGNCLFAQSTNQGSVCDNPLNAWNLTKITCAGRTVDQQARSFMLSFKDTSEFEVYFRTFRPEINYGRNFVFAFSSSLAEGCMLPPGAPTPSPTESPTVAPTPSPTAAPTSSPTAAPTPSPTAAPTSSPTAAPTPSPMVAPTSSPTSAPTKAPTAPTTPSPTMEMHPKCPPIGEGGSKGKSKGGRKSGSKGGSKGESKGGKAGKGGSKSSIPNDARTESFSSKGKSEKERRNLGVGAQDECPEADSSKKSGNGGSKGGSKSAKSSTESSKSAKTSTGSSKSGKSSKESSKSGKSSKGKSKSGKSSKST